MEHHHANTRGSTRGTNHLSQTRKSSGFAILFLAIILLFPVISGSGSAIPVVPVPTTFIVQSVSNGASYNAFLSTSSVSPFYTETNITKLVYDDIEHGGNCNLGCSLSALPGKYNVTQSIKIDVPAVTIIGVSATTFYPQKTVFSIGGGAAPRILFVINATNFVAQGFKADDFLRVNQAGINGELFNIGVLGTNCVLQQLTLWNASHAAIDVIGNNCLINQNTLFQSKQSTASNLEGINVALGAIGTRILANTIWYWNSSVGTTGIRLNSGATGTQMAQNDIEFNSFGISTALFGHSITIENNAAISNNGAAGILISTPAFGSGSGGPITIVGNSILDNSKDAGTISFCANSRCPGIMVTGTRPMWDTVTITGNTIKDDQTTPTQQNAIWLNSVQYSNLTITGNALGREATTTIIKLTVNPLVSWIITSNPGFNPQPVRGPLTAGASPFTYTNNDAYREQINLVAINGMTSLVCRGVTLILTNGETTPILNTLDTCVFTWAVTAPTYDVLPT